MHFLEESHILLFLLQVFVLLLLTRGLGELFHRHRQSALTAEILVGVFLGPTVLGRWLPDLQAALFPADPTQQTMLETAAWIGVLFLLLQTGLEIDFSVAWRRRGSALVIALTDVVLPMVVAFVPCLFLPSRYLVDPDQRVLFALFMATVMTISAMPVAARVLHDLNVLKADLGFLIMSALAVNDIIGWVLFTIVLAMFSQTALDLPALGAVVLGTVGFAALALTVGRRLSDAVLAFLRQRAFPEPGTSLTFAVLLGLLFGAFTQSLGIHALFGFFLAGVVIGESRALSEGTRNIITQMVYAIFVPLFFANIGLKLDVAANFDPFLVIFMCAIGICGRYLGAWVGVSLTPTAKMDRDLVAIAHTPGGMMEIVVALLAFETGLINARVFVAIVFSAVFSSMLCGPWMRHALQRRRRVSIGDYLAEAAVLPELSAVTCQAAIQELARALPQTDRGEEVAAQALKREDEFGTAIGGGVAIPHARIPGLRDPILAFGRSPAGIDWNAPDGQPVHWVFLLVTPTGASDVHVQGLAAIARAMASQSARVRLENAVEPAELTAALRQALVPPAPRTPPG